MLFYYADKAFYALWEKSQNNWNLCSSDIAEGRTQLNKYIYNAKEINNISAKDKYFNWLVIIIY